MPTEVIVALIVFLAVFGAVIVIVALAVKAKYKNKPNNPSTPFLDSYIHASAPKDPATRTTAVITLTARNHTRLRLGGFCSVKTASG